MSVTTVKSFPEAVARPRASLAVAMLGFFVVALDAQIVNVALPEIRNDFGGGLSGLQWIVTGYTLMFSALQLFAGTFSDRVGARRAYGIGMILFTVASMACGFSPSLPALIAGRVLQGIGAAMITPTSLALIREAFHDPARRGRAIVYWGLGGSVAAAAGPVLGGILTQLDWRLIFFVNLPVGVAALLVLSRVAPSPHILLTFAICVASAAVFVAAQARGSHPMIPLDLFRSRAVSTALIVAGVTMAAFYGVVFLQSLYFQQERGASALETGLLFLPMTGLVALLNPLVARFAERFGRIVAIVSGQLLMAAGLASLCLLPGNAPTLLVAFLMVPVGVGGSFTVPPIIALILDHLPAELAGTASGAVNTARQLGGSLGVAIFGAALAGQDFMAGLRINLSITALLLLVLVAVSLPLRHAQQSRH
ncbi:MFS transporter [Arthrobacter sp. efr-133-TYG-120]|uniref:MFS transporter n=1 Tax=Arthrobacter sp. efr-133-TYG-120 TaxID=3040280 RepID=UPI00254C73CC|nr:MFS transporter [Arthrobacter sp. efr-133-TYG-120]